MDTSRLADLLRSQNFGPNDSQILSAINHPLTAAQKGADWFAGQVSRAANIPNQQDMTDNPYPFAGYTPEQQVGGALNLAGLAQTGAYPLAPQGAGTLGTITKFEKAHQAAQRNAALPVEQGGLGLPANNTAMERADAMNALDWYHGTERLDRLVGAGKLNPKKATSGPMPYGTTDPELASGYAMNKADTSLIAETEGEFPSYFTVSPKSLGLSGRTPYTVEQSYRFLSPEKKRELIDKYYRIGYENPYEASGNIVLHPEQGLSIAGKEHLDYVLNKEERGNPLSAIRNLWGESGELYDNPEALADIYKLAGYPHEILQDTAPWYQAKGVFAGKILAKNPLVTSNIEELQKTVIPHLEQAFKRDRTQRRIGADLWDKNSKFTPKEWVQELKKDIEAGENSYVWTSIPDKVTKELKALGYDSIHDIAGKSGMTEQSPVLIPFEPHQIRSRFAAFDPMQINSPNILAGGALGALLLNQEYNKDKQ